MLYARLFVAMSLVPTSISYQKLRGPAVWQATQCRSTQPNRRTQSGAHVRQAHSAEGLEGMSTATDSCADEELAQQ